VRKNYPGRASISPALDLLITLLSMGVEGWRRMLEERKDVYGYMRGKLEVLAEANGARLLVTPGRA
jgi:O-phospho-L-seryl-tRNASec:L-selenocysteinyl-tRNA synthase